MIVDIAHTQQGNFLDASFSQARQKALYNAMWDIVNNLIIKTVTNTNTLR